MAVTFQEIIDWKPPVDLLKPYNNLINCLDELFPKDWKSWEIVNVSFTDLFGETVSEETENELQFAVPFDDLITCFNGKNASVSEEEAILWRKLLMQWPIGRAIIWYPQHIVKKVHKGKYYVKFMNAVESFKSRLVEEAALDLEEVRAGKRSGSPPRLAPPRKRVRSTQHQRVVATLAKHTRMLNTLMHMSKKQQKSIDYLKDTIESNVHRDDSDRSEPSSQAESEQNNSDEWRAPPFHFEITASPPAEPDLPAPDPEIARQGIELQKFNTDQWDQFKCAEFEKRFEASPVFTSLKVNDILRSVTPRSEELDHLESWERTLAVLTHGLLKQQQCLREAVARSPARVRGALERALLAADCEHARTSAALLRFVCGARAEALARRRHVYRARSAALHGRLHAIPPSGTHLFQDDQLAALVRRCGGVTKLFTTNVSRPATEL